MGLGIPIRGIWLRALSKGCSHPRLKGELPIRGVQAIRAVKFLGYESLYTGTYQLDVTLEVTDQ